jgi:hypothetical protein
MLLAEIPLLIRSEPDAALSEGVANEIDETTSTIASMLDRLGIRDDVEYLVRHRKYVCQCLERESSAFCQDPLDASRYFLMLRGFKCFRGFFMARLTTVDTQTLETKKETEDTEEGEGEVDEASCERLSNSFDSPWFRLFDYAKEMRRAAVRANVLTCMSISVTVMTAASVLIKSTVVKNYVCSL